MSRPRNSRVEGSRQCRSSAMKSRGCRVASASSHASNASRVWCLWRCGVTRRGDSTPGVGVPAMRQTGAPLQAGASQTTPAPPPAAGGLQSIGKSKPLFTRVQPCGATQRPVRAGYSMCLGRPGAYFLLSFPRHLWYLEHMFALTGPCAAVGPVSLLHGLQGPRWTFTPSLIKLLTSSVSGSA